jgi:hypothetical protein
MAAIARAVQVANRVEVEGGGEMDLTVLTDSLTTLQLVER